MPLGKLINNIFGSGDVEFEMPGFDAGGFTGAGGKIKSTAERLGLVKNVADRFGEQAIQTGDLLNKVKPGFSDFRASRLGEIEGARRSAIGNLRENMQRRRVLGSSFGQDSLVRAESEFGKEKERVQAESFLQELDLTNKLTQQMFQERRAEFETHLNNMNMEATIAGPLAAEATKQLGANARLNSEMNMKSAEGFGKFLGTMATAAFSDVRLKRDVSLLEVLANGLGLYLYRYLWSDVLYVGVMAHEVSAVRPDAVMRGAGGYLRVNYSMIGLRLRTLAEWLRGD